MKNKMFVDITVRRKSPIEVVFLSAVICGLSWVICRQQLKILQLEQEDKYGSVC